MTVIDSAMADINDSLAKVPPEKVVIDPKDLTPTDPADLKARVKSQGLDNDVKFGK